MLRGMGSSYFLKVWKLLLGCIEYLRACREKTPGEKRSKSDAVAWFSQTTQYKQLYFVEVIIQLFWSTLEDSGNKLKVFSFFIEYKGTKRLRLATRTVILVVYQDYCNVQCQNMTKTFLFIVHLAITILENAYVLTWNTIERVSFCCNHSFLKYMTPSTGF